MAAAGIIAVVYPVIGVNLKTTGTTVVLPAQAKRFALLGTAMVQRTRTGSGSAPLVTFGTVSSLYENLFGTGDFTFNSAFGNSNMDQVAPFYELTNTDDYLAYGDLTASGLRLNVQSASTYTTHTADFFIVGAVI